MIKKMPPKNGWGVKPRQKLENIENAVTTTLSKELIWVNIMMPKDTEPTSWLITVYMTLEYREKKFKAITQVSELQTWSRLSS